MVFSPGLLGWGAEDEDGWLRASQYFYKKAKKSGHTRSAWYGHYLTTSIGGVDKDVIDIYAYVPESDDKVLTQSPHFHMAGPNVWKLEPVYESVENLPPLIDPHMVCMAHSENSDIAALPMDVITRHILAPEEQINPFLGQICMLCSQLTVYDDELDYLRQVTAGEAPFLQPGQVIAPVFHRHFFEEMTPQEQRRTRPNMKERLVFVFAEVQGVAEHRLHGFDFLVEVQVQTPFGGLTLATNKEKNPEPIEPGQYCFAMGLLSADIAIYQNAGGFGH